jgi:hypothetical protein
MYEKNCASSSVVNRSVGLVLIFFVVNFLSEVTSEKKASNQSSSKSSFQSNENKETLEIALKFYKAAFVQKNKDLALRYVKSTRKDFIDFDLSQSEVPPDKVPPKKVLVIQFSDLKTSKAILSLQKRSR